jgi:hypothetical protein
MRKNAASKLALGRETLRQLDERWLDQAGAAVLTGTYSVTCADRTCGNCVTGALTSCRCTPYP